MREREESIENRFLRLCTTIACIAPVGEEIESEKGTEANERRFDIPANVRSMKY